MRAYDHAHPDHLEATLGGPARLGTSPPPSTSSMRRAILPPPPNETYANDSLYGTVLPPQPYPVPALQIAPVLRFNEILEIEKALHHVVRNTTLYSKAVWASLTPDERAILLDAYTIGVPLAACTTPAQMVPLLNCVENRLLGFFGNSMILPFIIPAGASPTAMKIDPAEIQQALLAYQQASFTPPRRRSRCPRSGVLGEGGARALSVGREDRSHTLLELAGFARGRRADDLAGYAAHDIAVDRGRSHGAQFAGHPAVV